MTMTMAMTMTMVMTMTTVMTLSARLPVWRTGTRPATVAVELTAMTHTAMTVVVVAVAAMRVAVWTSGWLGLATPPKQGQTICCHQQHRPAVSQNRHPELGVSVEGNGDHHDLG
eukprot:TRINITY_DN26336_c0_g2_i1.p3 TRINITY_DN26336_c0_g2~~TRINITY_DN26336_c0_g2_i1.p3  ORF type:complete len:114 (-),score=26.44 TRINITY_DN26336_c0_g2_i1:33-374(-)